MLLLWSPPLPPPVVPRLLRRASRWPPRAGPREQGPGRRAPSPPRRVRVQPPPAAGDAATSRLSISRGSAAKLPRLPPRLVRTSPGQGPSAAQVGAAPEPERASSRRGSAPRPELAVSGRGKGVAEGERGRARLPPLSPQARKIVPLWAIGVAGAWAAGGGPCGRRGRPASLRLSLARAPLSRLPPPS